ncbi:hypothetical protein BHE74_00046032, partial [Ensete ventricosum]
MWELSVFRFAISTCTARYRAVPAKIDHRRSISTVSNRLKREIDYRRTIEREIDRQQSIEEEKGKKKRKRIKKKEGKKEYLARAPSSPACRRRPRPRPLFLPRKETKRLPPRGEKDRGD